VIKVLAYFYDYQLQMVMIKVLPAPRQRMGRMEMKHSANLTVQPVDAGGTPAEWVEATVATVGQATLLIFDAGDRQTSRGERAGHLAVTTGARVLRVDCRPAGTLLSPIEAGVAAYEWLLGEGLDLARATFVGRYAAGVRDAACRKGLPVPEPGSLISGMVNVQRRADGA
jgi:hypothetical protein